MVFSSALTIGKLPAVAVSRALKQSTSPSSVQALSTGIARGSFQALENENISIVGNDIDIEFNESRLLTTAGLATAISLGSVYWLGSKLNIQLRYSKLENILLGLKNAIILGDTQRVDDLTRQANLLSNPLVNPENLELWTKTEADEVSSIYTTLFKKEATEGALFPGIKVIQTKADEAVKVGSRIAASIAIREVDEALEAVVAKSASRAGSVAARVAGAVLFVDTIYWLASSAIDIGLNFTGLPEEKQRIPFLADIPVIGGLFDVSTGFGTSPLDVAITGIINTVLGFFFEEEIESLIDIFWSIIVSAALNPLLTPFIIAILDFYIDSIDINSTVAFAVQFDKLDIDYYFDTFKLFKPEPLDILILWLYAITGKIIFKYWLLPIFTKNYQK